MVVIVVISESLEIMLSLSPEFGHQAKAQVDT